MTSSSAAPAATCCAEARATTGSRAEPAATTYGGDALAARPKCGGSARSDAPRAGGRRALKLPLGERQPGTLR